MVNHSFSATVTILINHPFNFFRGTKGSLMDCFDIWKVIVLISYDLHMIWLWRSSGSSSQLLCFCAIVFLPYPRYVLYIYCHKSLHLVNVCLHLTFIGFSNMNHRSMVEPTNAFHLYDQDVLGLGFHSAYWYLRFTFSMWIIHFSPLSLLAWLCHISLDNSFFAGGEFSQFVYHAEV